MRNLRDFTEYVVFIVFNKTSYLNNSSSSTDGKQKAFLKWRVGLEKFASDIVDDGFYKSEKANIVDFTVYPWVHRILIVEHFSEGELKLDQVNCGVTNYSIYFPDKIRST